MPSVRYKGYLVKDCSEPKRCCRCGKLGNAASQCSSEMDKRTCFLRRETGHTVDEVHRSRRSMGDRSPGGIRALLSGILWGNDRA